MAKKELSKDKRIKREIARLKSIYKDMEEKDKRFVESLIQRAAFMKITLEDCERDIVEGGYVESFSQSEKTEPYERDRPVTRLYNSMNKNYQSIMKQLGDYIPKTPPLPGPGAENKNKEDGFDEFVSDRRDD